MATNSLRMIAFVGYYFCVKFHVHIIFLSWGKATKRGFKETSPNTQKYSKNMFFTELKIIFFCLLIYVVVYKLQNFINSKKIKFENKN